MQIESNIKLYRFRYCPVLILSLIHIYGIASARLPQKAGAMLLPASWGHNPVSSGAEDGNNRTAPGNSNAPCGKTAVPGFPAGASLSLIHIYGLKVPDR